MENLKRVKKRSVQPINLSVNMLLALRAAIDAALAGDGFNGGDFDGMDIADFIAASEWLDQEISNRATAPERPD